MGMWRAGSARDGDPDDSPAASVAASASSHDPIDEYFGLGDGSGAPGARAWAHAAGARMAAIGRSSAKGKKKKAKKSGRGLSEVAKDAAAYARAVDSMARAPVRATAVRADLGGALYRMNDHEMVYGRAEIQPRPSPSRRRLKKTTGGRSRKATTPERALRHRRAGGGPMPIAPTAATAASRARNQEIRERSQTIAISRLARIESVVTRLDREAEAQRSLARRQRASLACGTSRWPYDPKTAWR